MNFKVDTKEKFTTITVNEPIIYVNVAASLTDFCATYLQSDVKNIILDLQEVNGVDEEAANSLAKLQQSFYEGNASFVICNMQKSVEDIFESLELLEFLNCTPTESEAWDIVQMEEIERELMDGEDVNFDTGS